MKKQFLFLAISLVSFINTHAAEPPSGSLNCSVVSFNIIGEDVVIHFDLLDGDNNNTFTNSQTISFTSEMSTVNVDLGVTSVEIIGEDVVIHFNGNSSNLNGLVIKSNQILSFN